jgi:hypothetical protein
MSDKISILRLNSGEEIICTYTTNINNDGEFIVIKQPAILIPGPEGKLMFAKWLPYMKQENGISLKREHVVFEGEPMEDLKDHYLSVVVNNLFVPSKKVATPELKLALDR